MSKRHQLLDRQKLLSRIMQLKWLIFGMYASERAGPFKAGQSRLTSDAGHSEAIIRTAHLWPIYWTETAHSTAVRAWNHQKSRPNSGTRMLLQVHLPSFGGRPALRL